MKFFQIAAVLFAITFVYVFLLPAWPIVYTAAFDSANYTAAGVNSYEYRATTAFLRWSPFGLFFVPAGIGVVLVFQILYKKREV